MPHDMMTTMMFLTIATVLLSTVSALRLSPLEQLTLGPRLSKITEQIQEEYAPIIQEQLRNNNNNDDVTILFPGAGGVDELVLELQRSHPSSIIVDWKSYRGSILTAAYDGEAVGEGIANLLRDAPSLHFIGISVGGFCANAAACASQTAQLTLLDPFCGRGVLQPNYGRMNFGKDCRGTALHILNTDDPVPTTNEALPNCFCLDVTRAAQRDDFVPPEGDTMHSWPVAYYARHHRSTKWADPSLHVPGRVIQVE